MNDARAITGSLVDVRNVNTHKCVRLIIDVPAENALAVIGAFGWATMVNPVSVAVARLHEAEEVEHRPRQSPETQPDGAKRSWDEILPSQQAGILCADERFRKFINDKHGAKVIDTADCATWVRRHCGVNSRANLTERLPNSLISWRNLVADFRLWDRGAIA